MRDQQEELAASFAASKLALPESREDPDGSKYYPTIPRKAAEIRGSPEEAYSRFPAVFGWGDLHELLGSVDEETAKSQIAKHYPFHKYASGDVLIRLAFSLGHSTTRFGRAQVLCRSQTGTTPR